MPDALIVHMTYLGYARVRSLPQEFMILGLGEFARLFVLSPEPALPVALKLARGNEHDMADAACWVAERRLSRDRIRAAIETLLMWRKAAAKNLGAGADWIRLTLPTRRRPLDR